MDVAAPTIAATIYSCIIDMAEKCAAIGTEKISAARTRSVTIKSGRLLLRSIYPPAKNATINPGAKLSADKIAISFGVALMVRMAIIGNTVRVIRDPKALPICAAQSFKKSECLSNEAGLGAFGIVRFRQFLGGNLVVQQSKRQFKRFGQAQGIWFFGEVKRQQEIRGAL